MKFYGAAKKIVSSLIMSLAFIGCAGGMGDGCCGWSGKEITGSGQVKRVSKITPMICPDYYQVDISLGVLRNGVGSMSTEDITLFLEDKDVASFKTAAQKGQLVEFTYDVRREVICVEHRRLTSFRILDQK